VVHDRARRDGRRSAEARSLDDEVRAERSARGARQARSGLKRVAVLGCSGAGKTRFAEQLAAETGLPLIYLDLVFWRAGWQRAPDEEATRDLAGIVAQDEWILDGDFLGLPAGRWERVDTVFFLDVARWRCFARVFMRVVLDRRRRRPDLPDGCDEALSWSLLRWVWRYPKVDRPRVLALLEELRRNGIAVTIRR
jgi:adenylate kinase family enzyme